MDITGNHSASMIQIIPQKQIVIFEGATKLPDNSENAVWDGLQHWCSLLSEIRRIIPDADWQVNVLTIMKSNGMMQRRNMTLPNEGR